MGARGVTADDKILSDLAQLCDGDLRRALNALEVLVLGLPEGAAKLTPAELEIFARERRIRYDADEDEHYDTISAFIKSCRGSDPDAAMYWLAKMLAGGEDPRFIARRPGDPGERRCRPRRSAGAAAHGGGAPRRVISSACRGGGTDARACGRCYVATAPKSNSATLALGEAHRFVKGTEPVQTIPLRAAQQGAARPTSRIGQGKGHQYSHDYPENISGQDYP